MLQLLEPLNIGQGKSWLGPYFFDFLQQGLNETYRYKTIKTFVGIKFWPYLSLAQWCWNAAASFKWKYDFLTSVEKMEKKSNFESGLAL